MNNSEPSRDTITSVSAEIDAGYSCFEERNQTYRENTGIDREIDDGEINNIDVYGCENTIFF